jgi:hypothetical protein
LSHVEKSERAEVVLGQAGLLQDLPKRSSGQGAWVHCRAGVATIWVAENFVASALPHFRETGSKTRGEDITGGVGHQTKGTGHLLAGNALICLATDFKCC